MLRSSRALGLALVLVALVALAPTAPAGAGRPGSYPPGSTDDCDGLSKTQEGWDYDVAFAYIHQLARCPSTDELEYWTGRMGAGMTRLQLAESVGRSSESVSRRAAELYDRAEIKDVDPDEVAAAATSFRATRDVVPATVAALASDAFFTQHFDGLPASDWVDEVYALVLDRPAEEGVAVYWGERYDLETVPGRTRVLTLIMRSAEYRRSWITDLYDSILRRTPDAGGLAHWDGWLRGTGRGRTLLLRSMFIASLEARGIAFCPSDC